MGYAIFNNKLQSNNINILKCVDKPLYDLCFNQDFEKYLLEV